MDEPYSGFEHLFYPQERAPTLIVPSSGGVMFGGVVAGGDQLGLQRWSLAGYVQPAKSRTHWGGAASYLNTMLAPVMVLAEGSTIDWVDTQQDMAMTMTERKTRDASVGLGYLYRDTWFTTIAGTYTSDRDPQLRAIGGPQLATTWYSTETTRYTGDRRALLAGAAVAFYPRQASTFASDITDVGGSLGTVLPLPFGRRHTLHASVRARALISSADTGLLQLGGDSGLAELWSHSSTATGPGFDDTRFAPNLRFVEPLRGYEDYSITTDRAEIANLSWQYPIIIDRGVAATLRYGPPTYLRELDAELFGAGALDRAGNRHVAAGASLALHLELLRFPLVVTYQIARRLVDDNALTQLVVLAPGP